MESTPLLDAQLPVLSRQRLITVEPIQFLFSFYFSGSIPLVSQFVRSQLQRRYNSLTPTSNFTCGVMYNSHADRIQAEASTWLLYMNVSAMVPALFTTVLLGGWSDASGRKIALIPPLVGAAVRLFLFIVVVFFDWHPGFLILASVCDGVGGGTCTMLMALFSYICSVTSTESRSRRVVVVAVTSGLATIVSHLSVGYAIHFLGYAWTFVFLLGIIFTALCYTVFILPEVDPVSATTTVKAVFFTTEHFRRVLALYVLDDADGLGRHWKLRFTLLVLGVTSVVQLGCFDAETLFMLSAPLCFTSVWIGYFNVVSYFVTTLTNFIVTHIFVHHVGDLILMVVGLVCGTGYELMFGLSTNQVMLFLAPVAGCVSHLPIVLIRAYNSKIVRPDEIGLMFASVAWMELAGSLLGGVMQNAVFAATVSWMMNFVFMLDAAMYLVAAVLTMCLIGWLRYKSQHIIVSQVHVVDTWSEPVNSNTDSPE